jgi:hypothetical protein
MRQFTIEIRTVEGIGDSDLLDRLAELLYAGDALVDQLLGLEDDGSVTVSFAYTAPDVSTALEAVTRIAGAFAELLPAKRDAAVERLSIAPADEREPVLARPAVT